MTTQELSQIMQEAGVRPPVTLTLAITRACNLACHHCWVEAGPSAASLHVPVQILRSLMKESAAMGTAGICLTGGEPLSHPHWLELMRLSRMLGFQQVTLQTNAMLFRDEDITALGDLDFPGLCIRISLDGATPATHDLVRGEGAFGAALEGIGKLVRGGLAARISIFFTEMHHNLGEFPALLELAETMGIRSVIGGTLVACGRAATGTAVAAPLVDQYRHLLDRYDTDSRFRQLYQRMGTMAALEWHRNDEQRSECCTFIENPYLAATGKLYPCVMCHADDFAVAGVFEKGLVAACAEGVSLWSALGRISERRAEELSRCRECPARLACAGGCMGRAWGSCGNLMAPDDRCEVRRSITSALKR